ncbi:hypothetical protein CMEL01_15335 [Colletotrichum melonis]|uniref:Uncharacterized protein n=1 Tax=Colletotrichum melonis TaxID=1209925 RepID=A0AAI9XVE3_9PEZI|nr:hypothetical protein CMEL01_15335 [Colletotrichum melonis]
MFAQHTALDNHYRHQSISSIE